MLPANLLRRLEMAFAVVGLVRSRAMDGGKHRCSMRKKM
jgi:hypothetical protein